ILFLKEGMLDHVFDCAHEELKSLDQEEYMQFLTLNLSLKELEGYVLIIPERYLQDHESEIENALKTSGVTGNYTLINGSKHGVTNGFVLMKDGIEENHTFDSWIGYLREEMEGEILDILYERG
ncbi:MAG TPA: hypothetical protein IAC41_05590, partial [Candidatus Merdenecus merdavium]|nr:hypothetical protein [Candidatus Merdenecus merdavium]